MSQPMVPDASPHQAQGGGVRRVNNLPIYLIGVAIAIFLGIMALVAMDRSKVRPEASDTARRSGNSSLFAHELAGSRKDGIIAASYGAPPGEFGSHEQTPMLSPVPQAVLNPQYQADVERIRQLKLQQFEEGLKAKTSVQLPQPQARIPPDAALSSVPPNADPIAGYKQRLAQVRKAGLGGGSAGGGSGNDADDGEGSEQRKSRNDIAALAGRAGEDRWWLDSRPEAPRAEYAILTTFVIPATLISGINSQLPGKIFGQVSQNVYDTATGKYLLVPQGTKLEGIYSSEVVYGQRSVLVAWQRLVFPDGKTMDIGAMPGSNAAGYAGFTDQVNNHYVRLFGSAFLMSAITAGVALSQSRNQMAGTFGAPTTSSVLSATLGQQLGQVTSQLISRNINVSPTLEIRPGYRFNVTVTKDMVFNKPYQPFDY
ncbi:MAG: TrbI/VirB10 family protein [Nitrosospira sp.]